VTGGPFRVTRNPIYIALVLAFAGTGAMTAAGWLILLVPVLLLLLDLGVVRGEERYLARRFGPDYLAYARRVRRWL
jgi:protein-S-isoprenylcysteine O-methyltransferase Ste14